MYFQFFREVCKKRCVYEYIFCYSNGYGGNGKSITDTGRYSKQMTREYSFTLTVPLQQLDELESLFVQVRQICPQVRISRKTDRKGCARYYFSFPYSSSRPDLDFQKWFVENTNESWELFGPTHGRWGLC
ncbi:MAG: hypothetical protein V2I36_07110 [Desulfopila sp.]|jgi:hypothetical protein|nr:hypothetical protein [Desulfopila sp.]